MQRTRRYTLTPAGVVGLFFIERYRFLTIDQFARAASLSYDTASRQLRALERLGFLHFFGNTSLAGHGKTPKAYFLTRKGYELLLEEAGFPPESIGAYREVKADAAWSPQMYHRLRLVDVLLASECAIRDRPKLSMVKTFLEYCRRRVGDNFVRETTDFVAPEETAENKIIPDAAFILENTESRRRALFFLEMDMATEPVLSALVRGRGVSLHEKFVQYDRYSKACATGKRTLSSGISAPLRCFLSP